MVKKKAHLHSDFNCKKNQILKSKRSQSQLISTVLIILLVIVAIIVIWKVIDVFILRSTDTIQTDTDCLAIELEISSAAEGDALKVRRGNDEVDSLRGIAVFFDGTRVTNCEMPFTALESKATCYTIPADSEGKKIQIAKLLGEEGQAIEEMSICDFDGESDKGTEGSKGYTIRDGECNPAKLANCDESGECVMNEGYGWNATSIQCMPCNGIAQGVCATVGGCAWNVTEPAKCQ